MATYFLSQIIQDKQDTAGVVKRRTLEDFLGATVLADPHGFIYNSTVCTLDAV